MICQGLAWIFSCFFNNSLQWDRTDSDGPLYCIPKLTIRLLVMVSQTIISDCMEWINSERASGVTATAGTSARRVDFSVFTLSPIHRVVISQYHWYGESPTSCITDMGHWGVDNLRNTDAVIVVNSSDHRGGESASHCITITDAGTSQQLSESPILPVSLICSVGNSPTHQCREFIFDY